jgi:Peptidase family S41/Tricorn protease C1 domain
MKNIKINKKAILGLLLILSLNVYSQDNKIDNPVKNFNTLWTELNNYYSFFELKAVDWDVIKQKYSPMVKNNTTNNQLFSILSEMLGELNDGHVSLYDKKTGKRYGSGEKASFLKEFPKQDSLRLLISVIDTTLIRQGFNDLLYYKMKIPYLNNNIIAFTNNNRYGYVRINLMIGISNKELNSILDEIVENFVNVEGVIIDVRFNSGGYDNYSFQIAGRFADEKRLVHYKCTKKKKGFTDLKTYYLEPSGTNQIVKPIVVLTSDLSRSATDVFVLAMKQLPYVTIIGDNTYGIFSDVKEWKLPNGWRYTYSSQKFLTPEMKNLEGVGITPDIKMFNTRNNIKDGVDPLLLEAIKVLNQETSKNNK